MKQDEFKKLWKDIPNTNELMFEISNLNSDIRSSDDIKKQFKKNNIFFLASRKNQTGQGISFYCKM